MLTAVRKSVSGRVLGSYPIRVDTRKPLQDFHNTDHFGHVSPLLNAHFFPAVDIGVYDTKIHIIRFSGPVNNGDVLKWIAESGMRRITINEFLAFAEHIRTDLMRFGYNADDIIAPLFARDNDGYQITPCLTVYGGYIRLDVFKVDGSWEPNFLFFAAKA